MAVYSKTYIVGRNDSEGLHQKPSCAVWKLCIDAEDNYNSQIKLRNKKKGLASKIENVWDVIGIQGAPGDSIEVTADYKDKLKREIINIVEDIGKVIMNPKGTFVKDILNQ